MSRVKGSPKSGGRKPGGTNAATKSQKMSISQAAQCHTDLALSVLVDVARNGLAEAARVSAANALLDRAYGKPVQGMELTGKDGGPLQTITTAMTPQQAADAYHATLHTDKG